MPQIKNKSYREFIDTGLITLYSEEEFKKHLAEIKPRKEPEAWRYFCILLFYSGRRPIEVLQLERNQVNKKGKFVTILFKTAKKGRASLTYYHTKRLPLMLEFWEWFKNFFPKEKPLMMLGAAQMVKVRYYTKPSKDYPGGEFREKEYPRPTKNLTHYFTEWFGVPPYFFRHNRASDMAEKGASGTQIAHQRGTSMAATERYMHLSEKRAKQTSKFIGDD